MVCTKCSTEPAQTTQMLFTKLNRHKETKSIALALKPLVAFDRAHHCAMSNGAAFFFSLEFRSSRFCYYHRTILDK